MSLLLQRFPATLQLAVSATLIVLIVGIPLGILSAIKQGGVLDVLASSLAIAGRAMPTFWLGLMAIIVFAVELGWLPTSGRGTWKHLLMPATTLALASMADIILLVRSGLIDTMYEDYIRTARAKGLAERRIYLTHALQNTALPVMSVIGITFGQLLGGSVVTETVFAWPGVGSLAVESLGARDFPVVQAAVFLFASLVILANLAVDLGYGFVDPRIRITGSR